jgi:hypothetical protein
MKIKWGGKSKKKGEKMQNKKKVKRRCSPVYTQTIYVKKTFFSVEEAFP